MNLSWDLVKKSLGAGTVVRDSHFEFEDGEIAAKWIIILSDDIIDDSYVFCITTSDKNSNYNHSSFSDFIRTSEPPFTTETIIEVERIDLIKISKLEYKFNQGYLSIHTLNDKLLSEILDHIYESTRIPEDIKSDWLGM